MSETNVADDFLGEIRFETPFFASGTSREIPVLVCSLPAKYDCDDVADDMEGEKKTLALSDK